MAPEPPPAPDDSLLDTTFSHSRQGERPPPPRMAALTVLSHPDVRRVGERAPLPQLATGEDVLLSRLMPAFSPPRGGRPRPLADKYLSRQPAVLAPRPGGRDLVVERSGVRSRVEIDGEEAEDGHPIPWQSLERGVTLALAGRVALLLHIVELSPGVDPPDYGLVGDHSDMVRLKREIQRVAPHGVPVLIRGATGTGKELVARAIHRSGPRAPRPLLAVNMGAIPPTLAAAELFGAVRGAYTGAERREGFFRRANGGTLFLDEIGEAPPDVQAMLLRALETSEIQPVGTTAPVRVDVRIVAATDAALETDIQEGRFRAPLLHRLSGYTLDVPSLQRRREDVGRLLFHFLAEELGKIGQGHRLGPLGAKERPWLPATLVARLARHGWPGNVRQLRNVARQLVIGGVGADPEELEALGERALRGPAPADRKRSEDSGEPSPPTPPPRTPPKSYRPPHEVSDEELVDALKAHRWNLKPTAEYLGVSRASLYVLIDRSPSVRRAGDLDDAEITASRKRHGGDLDAMADELKVSRYGLQQRLRKSGQDN